MEKSKLRCYRMILLTMLILLGGLLETGFVSYAFSMSGKNITVVYDGQYHYPEITITGDCTVTYSYTDEVTGEAVTSGELPAFKEIGVHKVSYSVTVGSNTVGGSNTLTIVEDPVTKFKKRYGEAIETFDGSLEYTDIDCSDLEIDAYGDDTKENFSTSVSNILRYVWADLYSDFWLNGMNSSFVKPERFWISKVRIQVDPATDKLNYVRVFFDTSITKDQFNSYRSVITSMENRIMAPTEAFLSHVSDNGGDSVNAEDVVFLIHDAMARELNFAYEKYKNGLGGDTELHTSWGLLANQEGLCDGYAYLFKYFMDRYGIECKVVCSESLNHAFNVVKVENDSDWHVVDVSWDDLVVENHTFTDSFSNVPSTPHTMYGEVDEDYNDLGYVSHAYLMQTAAQMKAYGYGESSTWYEMTAPGTISATALESYSSQIRKRAYTNVEGGIPYVKGYCYYANASGAEKSITKTTLNNEETTTIDTLFAVRYLQSDGNYLYYTNGKLLVRTDLDGSNSMICNALPETGITELVYRNNRLYYSYRKDGSEVISSVDPTKDVWTATDGTIAVTVKDYAGTYDGQGHGIEVQVDSNVTVTYSEDGKTYSEQMPVYNKAGEYTIYYRAECYGFDPVEDTATVTITRPAITVKAKAQSIVYGTTVSSTPKDVEVTKGALATGDSISSVSLTASTDKLTTEGTITLDSVLIENESGEDCTDQYDITYSDGLLEITHDESMEPETITVSGKTDSIHIGNEVLAKDISVKVTYADGYVMSVTEFSTNLDSIDWTTAGVKKIVVSFSIAGVSYEKSIEVEVTDHSYDKGKIVKAATCSEVGKKVYTCTLCEASYDEELPIDASNHTWGEAVITKAATCKENGSRTKTCSSCKLVQEETILAGPDHHQYTKVVTQPTCTEKGFTTSTCTVCEDVVVSDYVVAKGHAWGEAVITKEATCKENGSQTKTCSACELVQEETILAGPDHHKYTKVVTQPTCTEKGFTTSTCSVCGDVVVSDYVVAKGHTWSDWVTKKEATCSAVGEKTAICTTCGEEKTDIISKLAHKYEEVLHVATVTEDGSITKVCSVCNHEAEDKQMIAHPKTLKLDAKSYVYNGKTFKPEVEVIDANGDAVPEEDYKVKYTSNKKAGVAKVTVTFSGNYKGTMYKSFLIYPAKVTKVTLKPGKKQLKTSWTKQSSGITGYEIQYATASNFKDKKSILVKSASTPSKTISSLKEKKKYYVRIRAYKTVTVNGKSQKLYGAWSSKKYCKTK